MLSIDEKTARLYGCLVFLLKFGNGLVFSDRGLGKSQEFDILATTLSASHEPPHLDDILQEMRPAVIT